MYTYLKNSKWNKKLNFTENNKFLDFKIRNSIFKAKFAK